MKNILLSIILILPLNISLLKGQNFKLYYNLEFVRDTISNKKENKQMLLWINKDSVIFCSNELRIRDSLYLKNNNEINNEIYISNQEIEFMTIKDKNSISKYSSIDSYLYKTLEKNKNLNWQIQKDIKNINGFTCQLATLKYKGREWRAWFDRSYPIYLAHTFFMDYRESLFDFMI